MPNSWAPSRAPRLRKASLCMSDPDALDRAELAQRWVRIATDDTRVARGCLDLAPPVPGGAAYHCQQAVAKLLKACLILGQVEFRKTHDLFWLSDLATGAYPHLAPIVVGMSEWTIWGAVYRYPGGKHNHPEPTADGLAQALASIAALREAVQTLV